MKFSCLQCGYEYDTSDWVRSEFDGEFQCNQCDQWIKVPVPERDYDAEAKDIVYDSELGVSFEVTKGVGNE